MHYRYVLRCDYGYSPNSFYRCGRTLKIITHAKEMEVTLPQDFEDDLFEVCAWAGMGGMFGVADLAE